MCRPPDRLAGTGVGGSHRPDAGGGELARHRERLRLEQLGDAEVEQLGPAVICDQDIARFDVPVDDQVLVRVLHGRANGPEQLQSIDHREPVAIAVLIDRHALDVVHHEVGRSVLGGAAVEQLGDVRVVVVARQVAAVHVRAAADQEVAVEVAVEDLVEELGPEAVDADDEHRRAVDAEVVLPVRILGEGDVPEVRALAGGPEIRAIQKGGLAAALLAEVEDTREDRAELKVEGRETDLEEGLKVNRVADHRLVVEIVETVRCASADDLDATQASALAHLLEAVAERLGDDADLSLARLRRQRGVEQCQHVLVVRCRRTVPRCRSDHEGLDVGAVLGSDDGLGAAPCRPGSAHQAAHDLAGAEGARSGVERLPDDRVGVEPGDEVDLRKRVEGADRRDLELASQNVGAVRLAPRVAPIDRRLREIVGEARPHRIDVAVEIVHRRLGARVVVRAVGQVKGLAGARGQREARQ